VYAYVSSTPGHPERHETPGVEVTTGPLGQGFCNAVGMAIAQEKLRAEFNDDADAEPLIDNHVYVIMGDGCHQEGVTSEAASLAGHLKLGRLICLYDDNNITIDGGTDLSFSEDVGARFESYGWQVLTVEDGNHDLAGIEEVRKFDVSSLMKRAPFSFFSPCSCSFDFLCVCVCVCVCV
jgi:transketolase